MLLLLLLLLLLRQGMDVGEFAVGLSALAVDAVTLAVPDAGALPVPGLQVQT